MKQLNNAFATWFYLGQIPKAPGTWGTLGGLAFVYIVSLHWEDVFGHNIDLWQFIVFTFALFLLGVLSAGKFDKDHGTKDSKMIVIDEVVGIMITCMPMVFLADRYEVPLAFDGWKQPLIAFILFRFFDILKPWPISLADQKIKGGLGVMLDDVLAGIAAATCFVIIGYTFHEYIYVG